MLISRRDRRIDWSHVGQADKLNKEETEVQASLRLDRRIF